MSASHCALNSRDREILMFLWRWKIATAATLYRRFFYPDADPKTAYHRMRKLRMSGYVSMGADERLENFYWMLAKKGYKVVRESCPELREEGYLSESPRHDLLVNAFHIGEWLDGAPEYVKLYTEQQLRRVAISARPGWVPTADHHRPDGYWGFLNEGAVKLTALEVELHLKKRDSYESVAHFYSEESRIDRVMWLVSTPGTAESILASLSQTAPRCVQMHNFSLVRDFENLGWQAEVMAGPNRGKPIGSLLDREWSPQNTSKKLSKAFLLNGRKSFFVSKTSPDRASAALCQLAPAIGQCASSSSLPAESPLSSPSPIPALLLGGKTAE